MKNFNALLDILQQFIATICGVYYNYTEKTIFIVLPWTGDSEIGLFNTLFFNNGSAQLRVVVEEYSSENFLKGGENSLISYNTLVNKFQPLDLESNKGDLDGFSKILNASKKLWGLKEFQEILKEFLEEENFGDKISTYSIAGEEELFAIYFPETIMVFGYCDEESKYKLELRPRPSYCEVEILASASQEADIENRISHLIRKITQGEEEEAVEQTVSFFFSF